MRLLSLLLVVTAAGCKGGSGGGAGDAGMPGTPTGAPPVAAIASNPDYVGLRTTLDGTRSKDVQGRALAYAWTVTSVPTGSLLTGGGADPTFSFVADVGGD